jgi:formylmethanofuran dehydrogenase subunit B
MAAWIRGQSATIEDAVGAAAQALAAARAPVIAGLAADVDAIRAAYRLGSEIGASLDPVSSPSLYADLSALASSGTMSTTRSEAIGRADLVLAIGSGAAQAPLMQSLRSSEATIGRGAGSRSVMVLAAGQDIQAEDSGFVADRKELPAVLGLLRALAAGRIEIDHPLAEWVPKLKQARFGVALYDAEELGDLAVETLHGLITDLNETTRFFTVSLADAWQGQSIRQVVSWTTGLSPRIGFGRPLPEHDPWRFDAARQAEAGEADAVIWLASVEAPQPAWTRSIPSVALIGEARGDEADVVIAVGIPGDTAPGVLFDGRRGALTYRDAVRPGEAPSAADVLEEIERAVQSRRGSGC